MAGYNDIDTGPRHNLLYSCYDRDTWVIRVEWYSLTDHRKSDANIAFHNSISNTRGQEG